MSPIDKQICLPGLLLMLLAGSSVAQADIMTFDGSNVSLGLSAEAVFDLQGTTLSIILTNESLKTVNIPGDVLTGLFFNSSDLTPVSAALTGSSTVVDGTVPNVGAGWQYLNGLGSGKLTGNYDSGISAAGFNVFGPNGNFYSSPVNMGGANYGIINAGSVGTNNGFLNQGPYIQDSITFKLTTSNGFKFSDLGNTVVFQYGTSLSEPSLVGTVPEGGSTIEFLAADLVLLALYGGFCYLRRTRRTSLRA